ncbi:MAG: ABC transporter substrate-binding protein [Clostridia bacterium]|nr:ABC transporter substrate-binding protein [Clostridia bacterium]
MKKLGSVVLAALLALVMLCFAACTVQIGDITEDENTSQTNKTYKVGICQLVQHEALDAATEGFKQALTDKLGADKVEFDVQNGSGQTDMCVTIVNSFVSQKVDLIMANATPALQAAANATLDIPILGTSITEYGVALDIENFNGVVGRNISGTSDLAPLAEQADMVLEFAPEAKTVGILYCSAEANSVYQAKVVKEALEGKGLTVKIFTFSDSNDVSQVSSQAASECDALYIPTDNTAASCAETINGVVAPTKTPIIAGEEGICRGCGVATLSISYYNLGYKTGEMAAEVLTGKADITTLAIAYDEHPVKKYNKTLCDELGITVPEGYEAIAD